MSQINKHIMEIKVKNTQNQGVRVNWECFSDNYFLITQWFFD